MKNSDIYKLIFILKKSIKIVKFKIIMKFVKKKHVYLLNLEYRKKSNITNIISFSYLDNILKKRNIKHLGDIIICPDVIMMQARKMKIMHYQCYNKIVIHAVLHLLGFDHKNYYEYIKMKNIEHKIMLKSKCMFPKKYR